MYKRNEWTTGRDAREGPRRDGIKQVVMLNSGMDTRAYRLLLPAGEGPPPFLFTHHHHQSYHTRLNSPTVSKAPLTPPTALGWTV